jgi:glutamate synthase (NADPH/NADH) small chain
MGKPTGFLEYARETGGYRDKKLRLGDYKEVLKRLPYDKISIQGARCMDCGIPYCHTMGCPLYNLIPEWNDAVYTGDFKYAFERLELTNNFPEITGRVCPAPCESACTLSINMAPVSIKEIELAIVEYAFEQGWITPHPPVRETGQKVAVIGSGPAGLAAAGILRRYGHAVTVFEKDTKPGGLLRYGIPDFKLEKRIIDRRLDMMQAEGIEFECDVNIGEDISTRYLQKKYDAVLLALGARQPRDLPLSSRSLSGIYFAMEYLTNSNKVINGELSPEDLISAKDKVVLVLGGGDTGSDCIGTANRQGAKKIYQYEIMNKPQDWDKPYNPSWPYWPQILRSSSSQAEGCEREWGVNVKNFSGSGLNVQKAEFERVAWTRDHKGKMKMECLAGSNFSLDVDLVLLAMGFVHVEHNELLQDLAVVYNNRDNIKIDKNYMTNVPGVFAAGDSTTGASLVVRALYHGRQAAFAINKYLAG